MKIEVDEATCDIEQRVVFEDGAHTRTLKVRGRGRYIDELKSEIAAIQRERDEYQRGAAVAEGERDQAREELAVAEADRFAARKLARQMNEELAERRHAISNLRERVGELEDALEACKQGQVKAEKQWQQWRHVGFTIGGASVAAAAVDTWLDDCENLEAPLVAEIGEIYEAPRVVRVVTTYEYSDGTTSVIG